ncbi:MAG: heme exporter protein CcmD [Gammaproteobacteria bacterium]|nr:heme exporter protein CcmD [Gammaproteobacteria bacterium]
MLPEIQEFFHMGGYAFYVWSSYGLCFIVLVLNIIIPLCREKVIIRSIAIQVHRKQQK